ILPASISVLLGASLMMCSPAPEDKNTSDQQAPRAQTESPGDSHVEVLEQSLQALSTGEHRSAENIARNQYRHPVETLTFFGLAQDMTVVEIWPSRGWYTEIIAPFVNEKGKYYAAGFAKSDDAPEWRNNIIAGFDAMLKARPEHYGNAVVTELALPEKTAIAPEGPADRVLTFRNVHNWMKGGYADDVFAAMYQAL